MARKPGRTPPARPVGQGPNAPTAGPPADELDHLADAWIAGLVDSGERASSAGDREAEAKEDKTDGTRR